MVKMSLLRTVVTEYFFFLLGIEQIYVIVSPIKWGHSSWLLSTELVKYQLLQIFKIPLDLTDRIDQTDFSKAK